MQPISTIRSPLWGSRPVVSVSNTISRMSGLSRRVARLASSGHYLLHEPRDLGSGLGKRCPRVDDVIGAAALFDIGHLQREDALEALGGHPRPRENAGTLYGRR